MHFNDNKLSYHNTIAVKVIIFSALHVLKNQFKPISINILAFLDVMDYHFRFLFQSKKTVFMDKYFGPKRDYTLNIIISSCIYIF